MGRHKLVSPERSTTESANAFIWVPIYEPNPDRFKKPSKSQWAIRSGRYRIFRYDNHFELWCWPDLLGEFHSSDAAKSFAVRYSDELE